MVECFSSTCQACICFLISFQDSLIILLEVTESIEICHTIVIRFRHSAGKASPVLKQCQKKEKNITAAKSTVEQTRKLLSTEQLKCQETVLNSRKFEETFEDIERRLPVIEAAVIRQTPVSANYLVLKQQKISHEVIVFPLCVVGLLFSAFVIHAMMRTNRRTRLFLHVLTEIVKVRDE